MRIKIPKIYLKLTDEHRRIFAEKTLDLGFIAAGALIFGQLLAEKPFSWSFAGIGAVILFAVYYLSYVLLSGIKEVKAV